VYFNSRGFHEEAIMNRSQLPPDIEIHKALHDVKRRMEIIAAVLKDRIPLSSDVNEKKKHRAIRKQMLACVAALEDVPGRECCTEDNPPPVWETC
jgi:hypothetical protein